MKLRVCESVAKGNCHAEVFIQCAVLIAVSVTVIVYLLLVAIMFHCRFSSSEILRHHWMMKAVS